MKKIAVVGAIALLASSAVMAESDISTAAGPSSAAANLDIEVKIPRVLFLQVGTGTTQDVNGTIDKLTFTVPAATLGDGTSVAASGSDIGNTNNVTVKVFGNGGNITLKAVASANLSNGTNTIPWSEISVIPDVLPSTGGFVGTAIPHPPINDATGVVITATNKVVRQIGKWTYYYSNNNSYAEGTYGGTTTNGRITYTASMP
jgi:hypothetical protein